MYRNSPLAPLTFLVLSAALFSATFLSREKMIIRTGHTPEALTTIQIGMMAFALTFLIFSVIGFASIWLEGQELQLGRREPRRSNAAFAVAVGLCVLLLALEGFFAHVILRGLHGGGSSPALEGWAAGGMGLAAVLLLLVFQKYFVAREVIAEDEDVEVPW